MSKETAKSLFMVSSRPRLYQTLLTGMGSYDALGSRIVKQIKMAQAFRLVEQVRELATFLSHIPIREYQLIGQYYLIWCDCRESVYKAEALENLAGQTQTYKAQVLSSRAVIEAYQGNLETALCFYNEALKTSRAVPDYINMKLGIAQVKGLEGFHQSALNDIENLIPIIRHTEPKQFFETLNSYATELGEVGRLDEARNISRYVLASPLAFAYPEWQQTAADLQSGSRSMVQVAGSRNVLSMPPTPERVVESPPARPAKVFNLAEWKEKMVKEPNGKTDESDENLDAMDGKDLLLKLLQLTTKEDVDEDYLREIVKFAVERSTNKNKTDKK